MSWQPCMTALRHAFGFCLLLMAQINSMPVSQREASQPMQMRLAQGRRPDTMVVSWTTSDTGRESMVLFGTDQSLGLNATGSVKRYSTHCSGSRTPTYVYHSGDIHSVTLSGLSPNTQYFYQVAINSEAVLTQQQAGDVLHALSAVRNFTTLPAVGDLSMPLSIAVLGDLGQTPDSVKTVEHIMDDTSLRLVLHAGDMSYADCDQDRWDSWGIMVDGLASTRAYMVAAGNHEIETDEVQKTTFTAYKYRFQMPEAKPEEDTTHGHELSPDCTPSVYSGHYDFGNSFYSFDFGGVHTVVLNTYTASEKGSKQYNWLLDDLDSVNRTVTPWLVVMMHGPWYNTFVSHHDESMTVAMRQAMEGIFVQFKVNVVYAGHVHAFSRSLPVAFDQVKGPGEAPVYIITGDGGNREGLDPNIHDTPAWSGFRNGTTFGHSELIIVNATHAQARWLANSQNERQVADATWLLNL